MNICDYCCRFRIKSYFCIENEKVSVSQQEKSFRLQGEAEKEERRWKAYRKIPSGKSGQSVEQKSPLTGRRQKSLSYILCNSSVTRFVRMQAVIAEEVLVDLPVRTEQFLSRIGKNVFFCFCHFFDLIVKMENPQRVNSVRQMPLILWEKSV